MCKGTGGRESRGIRNQLLILARWHVGEAGDKGVGVDWAGRQQRPELAGGRLCVLYPALDFDLVGYRNH